MEYTVKPVLNGHSKIDKKKILMTTGSLMKVESIAECSPWSILQYFWPSLSDNLSWSGQNIWPKPPLDSCVAAEESLPALHYSVDFIFLSFGIMGFIVELWNY